MFQFQFGFKKTMSFSNCYFSCRSQNRSLLQQKWYNLQWKSTHWAGSSLLSDWCVFLQSQKKNTGHQKLMNLRIFPQNRKETKRSTKMKEIHRNVPKWMVKRVDRFVTFNSQNPKTSKNSRLVIFINMLFVFLTV